MAGVKGKSGGARPNSGGARPNSGRKHKEPPTVEISANDDPKAFLVALMNDVSADARLRSDAAKALLPYVYQKLGEGGKKEERANASKNAAKGKFAPKDPPKLVVNNR